MARQYAPIYTAIWQDPTFTGLSQSAQRLYLLAISQPNVSWCGVVSFTARRWSRFAPDTNPRSVTRDVAELVDSGLVVLDDQTEELWIRSFIKYNVEAQPKLRNAATREFTEIHSVGIRMGIAKAYPWASPTPFPPDPDSGVLGVGVRCSVSKTTTTSTENTNTNTPNAEVLDEYHAEAERQADAWKAKDPGSIIDRQAWVAKRARTLAEQYGTEGLPKSQRHLRIVCPNPDCREGHDVSGSVPVPCPHCKQAASA